MMSCAAFAARLGVAAAKLEAGLTAPTEEYMEKVKTKAKEVLGSYEYGWPQLSPYTIENGNPNNTPGLREGDMRDSVEIKVEAVPLGAEGLVYSGELKALWFEMGTQVGQPPRSFLYQSIIRTEAEMGAIFVRFATGLFI